MAQILLDTKFWNKVFKILKPATIVVVKTNKGSGKNKLIPSNGLVALSYRDNLNGFFLKMLDGHFGDELLIARPGSIPRWKRIEADAFEKGFCPLTIDEIEKAILRVAIADGLIPDTATYGGKRVVEQRQEAFKSTIRFGFVYLVRNDEIYKIGITDNMLRRLKELKPDELLNSVRCINYKEIEKKMHAHFKNRRIPQTEYFRLDASEIEEAHSLMTEMANFKGNH